MSLPPTAASTFPCNLAVTVADADRIAVDLAERGPVAVIDRSEAYGLYTHEMRDYLARNHADVLARDATWLSIEVPA